MARGIIGKEKLNDFKKQLGFLLNRILAKITNSPLAADLLYLMNFPSQTFGCFQIIRSSIKVFHKAVVPKKIENANSQQKKIEFAA